MRAAGNPAAFLREADSKRKDGEYAAE